MSFTRDTPPLYAYLRPMMQARGWQLRDLAREANVSLSTLSHIKSGRTTEPNLANLSAIATALGRDLSEVLYIIGYPVVQSAPFGRELEALLELDPSLRAMVDQLTRLHEDDLRNVRSFITGLRQSVPAAARD